MLRYVIHPFLPPFLVLVLILFRRGKPHPLNLTHEFFKGQPLGYCLQIIPRS